MSLITILRPDYQDYQGYGWSGGCSPQVRGAKMLLVNERLPALNFEALRQQVQRTYGTTVAGILPVCEEISAS